MVIWNTSKTNCSRSENDDNHLGVKISSEEEDENLEEEDVADDFIAGEGEEESDVEAGGGRAMWSEGSIRVFTSVAPVARRRRTLEEATAVEERRAEKNEQRSEIAGREVGGMDFVCEVIRPNGDTLRDLQVTYDKCLTFSRDFSLSKIVEITL